MLEVAVLNSSEHFQETITESSFTIGSKNESNRIVINDDCVSDFQCQIDIVDENDDVRVHVTNLGRSLVLGDSRLHHLLSRKLTLPCLIGAGETQIQISLSNFNSAFDASIRELPNIGSSNEIKVVSDQVKIENSPSPETLSVWFEALGQLQRSTAGESTFFNLAARSVFNPGGLDGCIILRRHGKEWSIVAQHIPHLDRGINYRKDLIDMALKSKLPLFHDSSVLADSLSSKDTHAAVVCPVVDDNNEVIAMVYGFRNCQRSSNRKGIRFLEAKFVSLISDSISAGMCRLAREADRARQRVLLEQAFSPEIVDRLESNPNFMSGRDCEVTVLFADLRGFCRISETIGANLTYQLLTDVMDRFTKIVHHHKGVVIDFFGDGMSAFWNAPVEQSDHAALACQAGLAIDKTMVELNDVWSVEIGSRLRVGVGIHTGIAQVGNSGSKFRLKYGPQGNTVNVASRIEQSTKKLGVNVIVSGTTAARVSQSFVPQRICTAQLEGVNKETELMKLVEPQEYSQAIDFYSGYSNALELFESNNYLDALEILSGLSDSEDLPSPMLAFLLNEINDRLKAFHTQRVENEELADKNSSTAKTVVKL